MSFSTAARSIVSFLLLTLLVSAARLSAAQPSFAEFDRRARAGDQLSVVFFGASLTWGANASDPQLTSFRAVVGRRLEEMYPKARFKFWDAAIGGTGSQLGVFRMDRDVLRRKPDLVFLDFSANDDINSDDPETLASYESLVRRLVAEAQVPVVQVIFPFLWNVKFDSLDTMKRRKAHLRISEAYNTAVGRCHRVGPPARGRRQDHLRAHLAGRWSPSLRRRLRPLCRRRVDGVGRGRQGRQGLQGPGRKCSMPTPT